MTFIASSKWNNRRTIYLSLEIYSEIDLCRHTRTDEDNCLAWRRPGIFHCFCTLKLTRHAYRPSDSSLQVLQLLRVFARRYQRQGIIAMTSMSRKPLNRAVHRNSDVRSDRTSFHVSNWRRTGNQYIGPHDGETGGARQTQKLVFRKLVSVINKELSIYSTDASSSLCL